jgi:hypothetical protein
MNSKCVIAHSEPQVRDISLSGRENEQFAERAVRRERERAERETYNYTERFYVRLCNIKSRTQKKP